MDLVYSANPLFGNTEVELYQFKWQWYMERQKKPSGNYIFYHSSNFLLKIEFVIVILSTSFNRKYGIFVENTSNISFRSQSISQMAVLFLDLSMVVTVYLRFTRTVLGNAGGEVL